MCTSVYTCVYNTFGVNKTPIRGESTVNVLSGTSMSEEKTDEIIQVRVNLVGVNAMRFAALKEKYGFESNTDLIRLLIAKAYEREIGKPQAT